MATPSIGYDAAFGLNEFNQPKLISEVELLKNVVLYVLFSEPGQYPSLPMIGLNIEDRLYSFYDEIDVASLEKDITDQCAALGVYFQNGTIQCLKTKYKGQPSLLIHIEGNETYPSGYMRDSIRIGDTYMIGITYDELNKMIYNVTAVPKSN